MISKLVFSLGTLHLERVQYLLAIRYHPRQEHWDRYQDRDI